MSVSKIIKFYTFEPQPSMYNNGIYPISTLDLVKKSFPSCNTYRHEYEKEKYNIDILEIGINYIFGTCSKQSELKYTNFLQKRNKQTNETEPYTSIDPNTQLEAYTYFYIDCTKNRMSAIQHKNISKLHCILQDCIYAKSGNMVKFFIAPEKIRDVSHAAKQLKNMCKLQLSFAPEQSKDNIQLVAMSLGDFKYESYSVEFKLKQGSNNKLIDKLVEISTQERDNYNAIHLIGKNEYGLEETINFLETIYTKNTPFDITEDAVKNTSIIKKKLSEALA